MKRLLAMLAFAAVAVSAQAEVRYRASFLVPPGATNSYMRELGETGWATGSSDAGDFAYRDGVYKLLPGGLLWYSGISDAGEVLISDLTGAVFLYSAATDSVVADLTALGLAPVGVDRFGQVVGTRNGHPALFRAGVVTELPVAGTAHAASPAGHVVGYLDAGGTFLHYNGVTTALPFHRFAGFEDRKHIAVTPDGVVAGIYAGSMGEERLGIWNGGPEPLDLGSTFPGFTGGGFDPRGVNARADIFGNFYTDQPGWYERGFLYVAGEDAFYEVGTLGGHQTCLHGMDDNGTVVGHSTTADGPGASDFGYAVIFSNGKLYDLNTMVPAGTPSIGDWWGTINNAGQIYDNAVDRLDPAGWTYRAVLLNPLPTTRAAASGTLGADGRYTSNVNVALSASSTVAAITEIRYVVDGGNEKVIGGASGAFTISANGAHTIRYWAIDAGGHAETPKSLFLAVQKPGLVVDNASPVSTFVDAPLTIQLAASGGTDPVTWSATLPAGLTLVGNVISGTLTSAGEHDIAVGVVDASGKRSRSYLTVVAKEPLVITTPPVVDMVAVGGVAPITTTGGTAPFAWSVSAATPLPPGVALLGAQLTSIDVTPDGAYPVDVVVTDDAGLTATATVTLVFTTPVY